MFFVYVDRDPMSQAAECQTQTEAFDLVREYQAKGYTEAFYQSSEPSFDREVYYD